MSMRDYAVDDYGLLLTEETMKVIASKVCDDFEDMDEDEYGDALCEEASVNILEILQAKQAFSLLMD